MLKTSAREEAVMNKNMSTLDRIVRFVVVAIIAALYFAGQITGTAAIILGIVAVAFLLTSLIGWCPAYAVAHLSTCTACKREEKA
jgi:amino acid transporter